MAPFGHGNRRPVFYTRDLLIAGPPRLVVKTGDHVQIYLRQGNSFMKSIAFNHGAVVDHLTAGKHIDLAAEAKYQ